MKTAQQKGNPMANEWKPIVAYPDGWVDTFPGFIEGVDRVGGRTTYRKGASNV